MPAEPSRRRESVIDVVLHPVRLRILQEVAQHDVTTAQLREVLPDVTPATLYRHVNALLEAEVLSVVAERKVRGAVERTLAAGPRPAQAGEHELEEMSGTQLRRAFLAFVGHLSGEVDRYLDGPADPVRDGFGFGLTPVYLDEQDLADLQREMNELLEARYQRAAPGKRRLTLGTVLVPSVPAQPSAGADVAAT